MEFSQESLFRQKDSGRCSGASRRTVRSWSIRARIFRSFCLWLVPRLIDAKEVLRGFKASEHEQKILDFRSLDREIAARTSQFVASELSKKKPDITSAEHSKDFRVLSRELRRRQDTNRSVCSLMKWASGCWTCVHV